MPKDEIFVNCKSCLISPAIFAKLFAAILESGQMEKTNRTGLRKRRPLPFKIYRNITDNLSDQVADGLRQAILTGYYRKGEMLPKDRLRRHGQGLRLGAHQPAGLLRARS